MVKGTADFNGAGKAAGIEIWRIEQLSAVRNQKFAGETPKAKFEPFEGDSYIILHTKKNRFGKLEWDLYFWLGKTSSQDEKGAAAYWTVNLDDSLGGAPIQYRETMEHESERFLALWKGGVQYVSGEGAKSGFRKAKTKMEVETTLLHLKGKRSVRISQVPVAASSMNHGDVFILDTGKIIYLWNGKEANRAEKMKAVEVARNIKDDARGGKAIVSIINDGEETADFWKALGGKGSIKSAAEGGDDSAASKAGTPELYRVSDESGSLEVKLEKKGKLAKEDLDTNDTFVLTTGKGGPIYCWVGKKCTKQEKKAVFTTAQKFISERGYPDWTPVSVVKELAETPLFKQFFTKWTAPKVRQFNKAAKAGPKNVNKISVDSMVSQRASAAKVAQLPTGGKLVVYRIEDFELAPISAKTIGQFYGGDSYVIQYTYQDDRKREHIMIYFWLGGSSTADEKGAAALQARKLDDDAHGKAIQCRVVQGKEPADFCGLFSGRMVVHQGGRASGFKNSQTRKAIESDSYDTDGVSLFHVKGTSEVDTRAVQVEEVASSLNSGDCFVLLTPKTMFVWRGKGSNAQEKKVANNIAKILKEDRSVQVVDEGDEPAEFWKPLGGKAKYPESEQDSEEREPRLFQISDAKGYLDVEEIPQFAQVDLDIFDIFILDVFSQIYVWVGSKSNANEQKNALKTAIDYVTKSETHDNDTPITVVSPGNEPPGFRAAFLGWQEDFFKGDPLADAQKSLMGDARKAISNFDAGGKTLSLQDLTDMKNSGKYPAWVNKSTLEVYLNDADFKNLFKMSKEQFAAEKAWKQKSLKKKAGLF
jgi:hypothetical protein